MLIVSYDISNDKVRTKFAKYLQRFGRRLQLSVFEIENSRRILKNILIEIENRYKPLFTGADSILIFELTPSNKIYRYGYAVNEEKEILFL